MAGRGFSTAGISPLNLARAVSFYDQNNAARDVWTDWYFGAGAVSVQGTGDIAVGGTGVVTPSVAGSGSIVVGGSGTLTVGVRGTGSIAVGGVGTPVGAPIAVAGTGSITLGGVGTPVGAPFVISQRVIPVAPDGVTLVWGEARPVTVVQEANSVSVTADLATLVSAENPVIAWHDAPPLITVVQERPLMKVGPNGS